MTRDAVVAGALVLAFAALVTMHVLVVAALLARSPRWHALAALVVLPLAPYWALRGGMRFRGWAWVTAAVAYGVARVLAGF